MISQVPRLPRPGEGISGGRFSRSAGGKAATQAMALTRLGVQTSIVGVVGEDTFGSEMMEYLSSSGIDLTWVQRSNAHTGVAQILIDDCGENLIVVASGANHTLGPKHVRAALTAMAGPKTAVIANFGAPAPAVVEACRSAIAHNALLIVNPSPVRPIPDELEASSALAVLNEHEASAFDRDGRSYLAGAHALLTRGFAAVVVTRGAAGVDLLEQDSGTKHQSAFAAKTVDSTGAGDVFAAALTASLLWGEDRLDAIRFAAAAAALATEAVGAQGRLPTREETVALIRHQISEQP